MLLIIMLLLFSVSPLSAVYLRVGVYPNTPQIMPTENGQEGLAVDILNEIATKEGWHIEYVKGSWQECYRRLFDGDIDLQPVMGSNSERATDFDFSTQSIILIWGTIYHHPSLSVESVSDLQGKRIGLVRNGFIGISFDKMMKEASIDYIPVYVSEQEEIFRMVENKEVDAGTANRIFAEHHEHKYNIEHSPIVFSPAKMFFAVRKNKNAEILEAIDRNLLAMKNAPTSVYHESVNKWVHMPPKNEVTKAVMVTLYAVLLLAAISIITVLYLRRQINLQTKVLREKNELLRNELSWRKNAEKEMRKLGYIFQNAKVAIAVTDMDTNVILCNREFLLTHGLEENTSFSIHSLVSEISKENSKHYLEIIKDLGHLVYEIEHKIKGQVIPVGIDATVIYDDNHKAENIMYVITDITERRKDEDMLSRYMEELKSQNEELIHAQEEISIMAAKYREMFNLAPNGYITLNKNGVVLEANYNALAMLNIAGKFSNNYLLFRSVFDEYKSVLYRHLEEVFQCGEKRACELKLRGKDKEYIVVLTSVVLDPENKDNAKSFSSINDITSIKEAEEKARKYARELEEANSEIRDFTSIVSHDVRAPLVSIKGFAQELRYTLDEIKQNCLECPAGVTEIRNSNIELSGTVVPQYLSYIDSSVKKIDMLVNSILELAKVGKKELTIKAVNMDEIVKESLKSLAYQIEQTKSRIVLSDLGVVYADYSGMEMVVGNLLDNALKYLRPDRDGQIEIEAYERGNFKIISIKDNGRGIREEDFEKIFQIFGRVGKADVVGSGMGLSYTKTIIRRHGGDIWCESEEGEGSKFYFSIPKRPVGFRNVIKT